MNEPGPVNSDERQLSRSVFVSYATADRRQALEVCKAIERRGTKCWISCRDVEPGENYQEAIVRSIRDARAMVLVFSEAANNSEEIKKELSLASRYHLAVIAIRIEDVEPSDAFAYELSTRQWIDAFSGWDISLDALVRKIEQISGGRAYQPSQLVQPTSPRTRSLGLTRPMMGAVGALFLVIVLAVAWISLRPRYSVAAHSMTVRLAGFERLSDDVPGTLPDAVRDEIIAAFGEDGAVKVSTAAAAAGGAGPAYALSGTVRRDGDQIRVIAKLSNERSGTTLWSNKFQYASNELGRIPRWVAVDVGTIAHCGLFAASTYPETLPDTVLSDYLEYCGGSTGDVSWEPARALDRARKMVAAVPDFSWGWSAVASAISVLITDDPTSAEHAPLRKEAQKAAAKALALDPTNSDALESLSYTLDRDDLVGREDLLKRALSVRPVSTWTENGSYAHFLEEVGRNHDAIQQYRRSLNVLALNWEAQLWLGAALLREGKDKEAAQHFDAAVDLSTSPGFRNGVTRLNAVITQKDYAGALRSLEAPIEGDDSLPAAATNSAYKLGFRALINRSEQDRLAAVRALVALPTSQMGPTGILLIASLGAQADAVRIIEAGSKSKPLWRSLLFYPALARARADPSFPVVAERLGLMRYWKTTHTKPDVCTAIDEPAFCKMI